MMHFQETSGRHGAVEPEQWLQRHPEAGSLWDARPPGLLMGPPQGVDGCLNHELSLRKFPTHNDLYE